MQQGFEVVCKGRWRRRGQPRKDTNLAEYIVNYDCPFDRLSFTGAGTEYFNRRSSDFTKMDHVRTPSNLIGMMTASCSLRASETHASQSAWVTVPRQIVRRSEEHTSELQSPCNLVC